MVYKTYGRYIPNLTKMDGSAIERQFAESQSKKATSVVTNWDTIVILPVANNV